jgi:ferric-dicitrate binding protein FerR (iron transport regulator)
MDVRELLHRLPEPDPTGADRVWDRYLATRPRRDRLRGAPLWAPVMAIAAAAAAVLIVTNRPDPERSLVLDPDDLDRQLAWSQQVHLTLDGRGTATGTGKDLQIDWTSGTIGVEVAPNTGTRVSVVTEEGTVRVVGTVFQVKRDALGVTTEVRRGKVEVSCVDGWAGALGAGERHTCLPQRAAGLLGRADALADRGAGPEAVLEALDQGLGAVEAGSAVEGELLARRLGVRAEAGDVEGALADAERYLAAAHASRRSEVRASAARLALGAGGCGAAMTWLEPLRTDGTPEDRVILASCVAAHDPDEARALAAGALSEDAASIDAGWRAWAEGLLAGGVHRAVPTTNPRGDR